MTPDRPTGTSRRRRRQATPGDAAVPEVADRVFVYGTLMPGETLWPALRPFAVGWEPATARGRLWDTGRGYPAVRFDPRGSPIPGVLVALDPRRVADAVAVLDDVEAEGVLYRRVGVATSGGRGMAYEWLGPTDGLAALTAGWPGTAVT